LWVEADDFYFLFSLVNFHKSLENQILIPDWTYFHCPGAALVFNGTSSAAWEAGRSGNGGLNNLGQGSPSSGSGSGGARGGPTPGLNGCGGNGGSGAGNGPYYGQAGGGGYIKSPMY